MLVSIKKLKIAAWLLNQIILAKFWHTFDDFWLSKLENQIIRTKLGEKVGMSSTWSFNLPLHLSRLLNGNFIRAKQEEIYENISEVTSISR